MENLFEQAIKGKYRFNYKGVITTEDLYDLDLTALDSIYKDLNKQVKKSKEDSLLTSKTKEDVELENKISLVKYIFSEKVAEQNARIKEVEKKEKAKQIDHIILRKQQEELENKSIEELVAMKNAL